MSVLPGAAGILVVSAVLVSVSILLWMSRRRAKQERDEIETALLTERERSRSAREQAWQNAFLGQVVEELREFFDEDDLWSAATTSLGRALEASRVVAYEKDGRGIYRLRRQFVAEGVGALEEGSSLPASIVSDRELSARIARCDLASEEDPELRALAAGLRLRSLFVVPVEREGEERAALAIHHCEVPQKWTEGERRFVQRLAEHVARMLDRAELSRRLSYEAEVRAGLLRLARALSVLREVPAVVEVTCSVGAPLARATRSAVLIEDANGGFRVAASSGFADAASCPSVSALRAPLDEALRERAPVTLEWSERKVGHGPRAEARLVTLLPMFYGRELMGVLLLERSAGAPGVPEPLDHATAQSVAELVSGALKNARLFEALTASESGLRALYESTDDLVLDVDESGTVRDANPAACRALGQSRSELCGSRFETFLAPESLAAWRRLGPSIRRGAGMRQEPLRLRSKEGIAVEVLLDSIAAGPRARVVMRDVTELRRTEQQLRQSQKLEILGALAGGIAHDFNNVLGGILGYASLLRSHLKDRPTASKYVETIERSAVRGAELTGRLLAASRSSPSRLLPVNLNHVIEETLELLAQTIPKSIRIERRLDPHVRSILADASQLQQIVLNLCVNARDALPEGGLLRVSTRVLPPDESGERVQLSVEDTGVGMDSKTLSRLFEPFFSTKGEGGTGLGLSVVYGIVKSLGGDIGVKSSPGRGARFDVVLPCRWADESLGEREAESPSLGQGELILLVDDEKVLRELGKDILESHGYRVRTMSSGEEAIDYLERAPDRVALVILDVVMPGLSGNETYRRLRGIDRSVPVLLSSGLTAEESVQDILQEGAAGFIPKPYGIGDLTRAVSSVLRRGNATLVH